MGFNKKLKNTKNKRNNSIKNMKVLKRNINKLK